MKLLEKDESLQLLGSRKPMATRAPGPTWAKNFLHFGCYQKQKLAGQKQKGTELELQTWTQVIMYCTWNCSSFSWPTVLSLCSPVSLPPWSTPSWRASCPISPISPALSIFYIGNTPTPGSSQESHSFQHSHILLYFIGQRPVEDCPIQTLKFLVQYKSRVTSCHDGSCPDSSLIRCFWDRNSCLKKMYGCDSNCIDGINIAGSML